LAQLGIVAGEVARLGVDVTPKLEHAHGDGRYEDADQQKVPQTEHHSY
jgi:hypothetical protein